MASVAARPSDSSQGSLCPAGHYCPKASSRPIKCDKGKYCPNEGSKEPFGNCSAGYFCLAGASTSQPNDNITGSVCPKGAYCPSGSESPTLCPPGTFSNNTNSESILNCLSCSPGSFCQGYGNTAPTGPCNAGYYCPGGQQISNPNEFVCAAGYFCKESSAVQLQCFPGTYQDEAMQENCKVSCNLFFLND